MSLVVFKAKSLLPKIMLPGSIFATKGARAMGDAGRMPDDHQEVAGLQIAYVARDALTAHLRCPVFGRITTLNRKRGGAPLPN